jgi:hypothetical protein
VAGIYVEFVELFAGGDRRRWIDEKWGAYLT